MKFTYAIARLESGIRKIDVYVFEKETRSLPVFINGEIEYVNSNDLISNYKQAIKLLKEAK